MTHYTTYPSLAHPPPPPVAAAAAIRIHDWQPSWRSSVDDVRHVMQFLYTNWFLITLAFLAATPAVGGFSSCKTSESAVSCQVRTRYLDDVKCLLSSAGDIINCNDCESVIPPPPPLDIKPPWEEGTTTTPTTPTMTMTSSTTKSPNVTNASTTTTAASATTTGASSTEPPPPMVRTTAASPLPVTKEDAMTTKPLKVTGDNDGHDDGDDEPNSSESSHSGGYSSEDLFNEIKKTPGGDGRGRNKGRTTGIVFAILIPLIVFIVVVIWVRSKARPGTRGRYSVEKAIHRYLGRNSSPSASNTNGGTTPNNQQTGIEITAIESGIEIGTGTPVKSSAEITSDHEEGTVSSKMLNAKRGSSLSPEPDGTGSRKSSKTPIPEGVRKSSRQLRLDSQSLLVDNMDEDMSDDDSVNFEKRQAMLEDGLVLDNSVIVEEEAFEDVSLGDEDKPQGDEGKTS